MVLPGTAIFVSWDVILAVGYYIYAVIGQGNNMNTSINELADKIAKLEKQGLMTEAGIVKVKEAKASGLWSQPDRPH